MIVEVNSIPEGHSEINCNSDLEQFREELPYFENKVECRVEIDRVGTRMYFHIWYKGDFLLDCSRCLNRYPKKIYGDFRIILEENSQKSGRALDDDEIDYFYNERVQAVDISSELYDEILTAIPLMPICSSNCQGVSYKGSESESDGKQDLDSAIDPRWDALRKLKR